jgi:hypothetical protein
VISPITNTIVNIISILTRRFYRLKPSRKAVNVLQVYTGFMIKNISSFEFRKKTHQYWYNKSSDLRASAGTYGLP